MIVLSFTVPNISVNLLLVGQAFWDAESCEVYYGNLATSETSWDRPV